MKKCKALKTGATIGIAAASSPFDRNLFTHGLQTLHKLGFKTFYRKDIFDQNRYLAGDDSRRAEELIELFRSRAIDAVMFARGGYGSQRIIPLIDIEIIKKNRKPVVGFSDLTSLLNFLNSRCSVPTFYGPVLTQLGKHPKEETVSSLFNALTQEKELGTLPHGKARVLKPGRVKGKLAGGCLSIINSSIGTDYDLDVSDSILFIEDIGEKVYVLDRMLTQLKNSGKLDNAKAVIFGTLIPPKNEAHDIEAMIDDVMKDFMGPIITGFPAGHSDHFITMPLGVEYEINAKIGEEPVIEVCEEALR